MWISRVMSFFAFLLPAAAIHDFPRALLCFACACFVLFVFVFFFLTVHMRWLDTDCCGRGVADAGI